MGEKLRPANGKRATIKTKAKAIESGREDAKSELQRDVRGRETKGETRAEIKAGSLIWTWKG